MPVRLCFQIRKKIEKKQKLLYKFYVTPRNIAEGFERTVVQNLLKTSRMGTIAHRRRRKNRKSKTVIGFSPHCSGRVAHLVILQGSCQRKIICLACYQQEILLKFYLSFILCSLLYILC
jgi:hypothetical protein